MFASFPESIFFGEGHGSLAIFVDCCGAMLDEAEFLAEFAEENCFLREMIVLRSLLRQSQETTPQLSRQSQDASV